MNIIKLKVNNFEIIPEEKSYVIENQVNEFALEFEFDDTWEYETKYVVFDNEETTYKRPVINNQVIIPSELLNGRTTIQIYAQDVEDNEIVKRKPSFKYSFSILNSLSPDGVEEEDTPTPSQWEIYISQVESLCNNLQDQFDDLKEECETKCDDVLERMGQAEQDIQTNTDNIEINADNIDALNTALLDYSLISETGNKISMTINPTTYVITLSLKDKNDNVLSTQSIDLPLETMIVNASYSNGVLTFTLKNGQTIQVPIGDLISGLVSTDTFNQAVQGLSNRITTIENDYLKSSDKTELQSQITANDEDIEELQQENERLQRIVSGLPTKNASGTNYVLNDMVNCEIKEVSLKGNTSQDGTPTPDSPIAIQTVTGNQTIQCCGKNLFNKNNSNLQLDGLYITSSTILRSNQTKSIYIPCKPNVTYTISKTSSARFIVGTTNVVPELNTSIIDFQQNNSATSITITTSENANYLVVFYYHSSYDTSITPEQILNSIQIELGDTATSYEQFKPITNFPISLGTIELNKIGDYQDKIYKTDKWYLEKNVGKVVLNGSERWESESAAEGYTRYRNVDDVISEVINDNNGYNNYFTQRVNQAHGDYNYLYLQPNTRNIHIQINENICSDVDEFKEWLSTHNVITYYILNTPSITEITDETLISQLEALNNYILLTNNTIISNGNLPVISDITGYVDIMSLLSTNVVENRSVSTNSLTKSVDESKQPEETKEEEK